MHIRTHLTLTATGNRGARPTTRHTARHRARMTLRLLTAIAAFAILPVLTQPALAGVDDYPYSNAIPHNVANYDWWVDEDGDGIKDLGGDAELISPYGYYYRNCTDFVAWRLHSRNGFNLPGGIGNAADWGTWARNHGYVVDRTPSVGAVAWWNTGYGHVAWVERVNPDGTATWEEYNSNVRGGWSTGTGAPSFPTGGFIHFKDFPTTQPTTPTTQPTTPTTSTAGWKGEYYPNANLSGTPKYKYNQSLKFDWGNGSPLSGIPADNFSVRWTRKVNFGETKTYRFTTRTDDGVRLWIDGRLLIDKWTDMAPTSLSCDIYLTAGSHSIKMEYYEKGGGALAQLSWVVAPSSAPKTTPTASTPAPQTQGDPANYRKILRNTADGACYLITASGKRAWIPTGGDYQAMVNNGIQVVQTNWTTISRYPDAGYQAIVRRMDDPAISGPAQWIITKSGNPAGWENDYYLTQSAAGKSYTTNTATWALSNGRGQVRVNAYIPKQDAVAKVVYQIFDGGTYLGSVNVDQRICYGFVQLGTWQFSSGTVVVKVCDNDGAGPYGYLMGFDCVEAIPVG